MTGSPRPTAATDTARNGNSLLVAVVALFFIWGGFTSLNDVLIPKLKDLFQLSYTQAMLIQFAFFAAYAIVSLPAGSMVARLGYGRGIVTGLIIMGGGCVLFAPAASTASYPLFLVALFTLASGITILQVVANPLIARLGAAAGAHSRLTLAQAFNSLGTAVMPLIGAQLMLGDIAGRSSANLFGAELTAFQSRETAVVSHSYLGLALLMFVLAALFWLRRDQLGNSSGSVTRLAGSLRLLRQQPRLAFGVAAIFVYVGAEVTIGSLMVNYLMLPSTLHLDAQHAGRYLALYWGGALVGRFVGALLLRRIAGHRLLSAVAVGALTSTLMSALSSGAPAAGLLLAVGLMNAIMFPTIFSLAIEGLGGETPRGSSLLCMAIVGGALLPLCAGWIADSYTIATALGVPATCYALIAGFGWHARRPIAQKSDQP